ncbi:MAG: Zn-dependent hydrolase [Deinococcus sp.]|nr:Zn-dependent hydrolase [Deinococcus sp.]
MSQQALVVDGRRLQQRLEELARIGATAGGGVTRLALSDQDKAGRDLFCSWLRAAGLAVSVDAMGNIFGRRPGTDPQAPPVLSGSHLDTQPQGGRLDGALGVMAALEVAGSLNDHRIRTRRPIEVVAWTNEEGTRFSPGTIGSGVFSGVYDLDFAYSRTDREGRTQGAELKRIGYQGPVPCRPRPLTAYIELHIEQGPVLEANHNQIGAVTGVVGINWLKVTVNGEANHAGTTPMHLRHDPLVAAAAMVSAARHTATTLGHSLVATVGRLEVQPNSTNVIPRQVLFTIDLRGPGDQLIKVAREQLELAMAQAAQSEGVSVQIEPLYEVAAVQFSLQCITTVEQAAARFGYTQQRIMSGAGHDAQYLSRLCPTGMIFVPSKGGKSHTETEDTDWDDITRGGNVLLHTLLDLAGTA